MSTENDKQPEVVEEQPMFENEVLEPLVLEEAELEELGLGKPEVTEITEKVPEHMVIDDITVGDDPHPILSVNEIKMPLMRAVRLPPIPDTKWYNVWGKVKNGYTLSKPRKWIIEEEYHLYYPPLGICLCIPNGFVFDGASVPRVLWPFMSPTGAMFLAGLFHDFGYRYNCFFDCDRDMIHLDAGRSFFDMHFKKMGVFINNANTIATTARFGLWVAGIMSWNEHRENDKKPHDLFPKSVIKE